MLNRKGDTPYLTLPEASEEVNFLPTCSGKRVGNRKKKKEKEIHGRPTTSKIMVVDTAWLIYLGCVFILRPGFAFSDG